MSINAILVNSGLAGALSLGLATAYSFEPTQSQPVQIVSESFIVDELDLGPYNDCTTGCTATLLTKDYKYEIEVKFDYSGFKDGNGFQTWYDAEINSLDILSVATHDDEKEVNAYVDRYEIGLINEALVAEILEVRS